MMKRILLFLFMLHVAACVVSAQEVRPRGLLLWWEARRLVGARAASSLPDASGCKNDAFLVGGATFVDGPPRIELNGGSLVGSKPVQAERVTVEAVFRLDRNSGPAQLIVTTYPRRQRIGRMDKSNPRQWVMEARGAPFQRGEFEGYLQFGVFGEDQRWHMARSDFRPRRGWHYAAGTFDGRAVRFYLDGRWQRNAAAYRGRMNAPAPGRLRLPAVGAGDSRSSYGLQGAAALLRVYDRALSAKEIARGYQYAQRLIPALARREARKARRAKPRFKVLYSNDFTNLETCASPYHKKGQAFRPEMLKASVDEAAGADVHLLQPNTMWVPWWPSKVYPLAEHHKWWLAYFHLDPARDHVRIPPVHQYILNGGDPIQVFIERCRRRGQAAFLSARLNDAHHLQFVQRDKNKKAMHCICRFYAEHPEYRLGPDVNDWSQHVQNWAIPEVLAYKLSLIKELIARYDLDGLELDFMRHPYYFRLDQTTLAQRVRIMTDFVRQVREALDAKPGRRRWLCARVPCFVRLHDDLGVDLQEMVDAGLDMINLSAFYFTQQMNDVALVREMAPEACVYVEMCHCTMTGRSVGGYGDNRIFRRTTDQQFYTTAHLAYRRGADGVSLFNFVYYREHGRPGRGPFNEPPFHVLRHLRDPDWLARQPQWYVLAKAYHTPLPRSFTPGQSFTFRLDMAPTRHQRRDGLLRLMTETDCRRCRWSVRINGAALEPAAFVRKPLPHPYEAGLGEPNQYACFRCPRSCVRDGDNAIEVRLNSGPTVVLQYLDLVLP